MAILKLTPTINLIYWITNFSPGDFINCIDITNSVISNHCIITAQTLIPISHSLFPLVKLWILQAIPLSHLTLRRLIVQVCAPLLNLCIGKHYCMSVLLQNISVIIETLGNLCSIHVPAKCSKKSSVSKFHRARKILMRKRSKLQNIYPISPSIRSKLASIERDLISSHHKEKLYEKSLAVAKIKSDPKKNSSDMPTILVCGLVILVLFMNKRETY